MEDERHVRSAVGSPLLICVVIAILTSPHLDVRAIAAGPLTVGEIEGLLAGGVSAKRVTELIGDRGVAFVSDESVRDQLRAAGASEEMLVAVDRASLKFVRSRVPPDENKVEPSTPADSVGEPASAAIAGRPEPSAEPLRAQLVVRSNVSGDVVTIDGRKLGPSGPHGHEVEPGRHMVSVSKAGWGAEKREVTVSGGETETVRFRLSAEGDMVLVPGGPFYMGCNERVDDECDGDEKPGRTVNVPEFRIDRLEVTVADYGRCVRAGRCSADGVTTPSWGRDNPKFAEHCNWGKKGREQHPMNCVDWRQARSYCAWAGKRLPGEVEWEKAARGTDGRKYPWGNTPYERWNRVANMADESMRRRYPDEPVLAGYDDGWVGTAPVGSFPAGSSPYGAQDLVGNVCEWLESEGFYGRGCRGGSWVSAHLIYARASYRWSFAPANRNSFIGFRCVK